MKRPCDAELAGWWPNCTLGEDAPATKRARFSRTTELLQELEKHVAAALHARDQKDALERFRSRRLAERYPLACETNTQVDCEHVHDSHHSGTVSPCLTSTGASRSSATPAPVALPLSPDQNSEVCKDTPCLAPTPVVCTPVTSEKRSSDAGSDHAAEPPSLSI